MLKKFLSYYKNHWKLFAATLSSAVLMSGLDLIYPMFIQQLIDEHFPGRNLNMMIRISVILLIIYGLRFVFQYIVHYWGHVVGIRMETDMRSDLFTHLQKLSFKFFDNNKVGYLMSRVVNDLNNISELAHHGPEDLLISSMLLVGSLVILINMHWQLALVTFALIPIMFFFSKKLGEKMYHAFKVIREKMAEVNTIVEDSLSGIRVVKSFTNEDYENEKFCEGNHNYRRSREWAMKNMAQFHSGMNLFINLIRLSTLAAGGYFIYNGSLSVGQMVAFLFYVDMFMNPIRRLVNFNEQLQRGMSGFSRFKELLEVDPEIIDLPDAEELKDVEGLIKYEDVSFSYDNYEKVLTNVDIEVKPGKTVAFVGPSGAGKSTLTKLLPRFYEIDSGSLSIDNIDIKDVTLESLRRNIGIVQQDVFLFNGTVRENIAYGTANASTGEIEEAARKANAHEFILNLSEGYDTDIGERGVKLSGGQKQRVSIARSFLKNPPILILDEATSSLDNRSEKIIQESLEELAKGRTTLVVAHRLSTVINADQIIVLTESGIVERGKHNELIKNGGEYAQLYNEQFSSELAG
ncbi:Lipid A export ATP-binding/permease protein MsbA [Halanaerobium saccharolyticum subsp. saccharolyticum DSM 6643]|uniref:Lipid A export ATP-binding/permease protein MsbA n=1 Tax=Halanaerobium saccharolyticum subsp. saccharolyticum DSM 6643 TaxID=1293054 RepID=M5E1R5_9FIRM|nr:ABC transporter ATP-binding protein [Halanaerobium saccharolyticum]CCU80271.1 Lipid A export ATP-binding/permease protein MsbA [Halanaerobium saccharolyticum subsp. saccharolyticum DSM 6643]